MFFHLKQSKNNAFIVPHRPPLTYIVLLTLLLQEVLLPGRWQLWIFGGLGCVYKCECTCVWERLRENEGEGHRKRDLWVKSQLIAVLPFWNFLAFFRSENNVGSVAWLRNSSRLSCIFQSHPPKFSRQSLNFPWWNKCTPTHTARGIPNLSNNSANASFYSH